MEFGNLQKKFPISTVKMKRKLNRYTKCNLSLGAAIVRQIMDCFPLRLRKFYFLVSNEKNRNEIVARRVSTLIVINPSRDTFNQKSTAELPNQLVRRMSHLCMGLRTYGNFRLIALFFSGFDNGICRSYLPEFIVNS